MWHLHYCNDHNISRFLTFHLSEIDVCTSSRHYIQNYCKHALNFLHQKNWVENGILCLGCSSDPSLCQLRPWFDTSFISDKNKILHQSCVNFYLPRQSRHHSIILVTNHPRLLITVVSGFTMKSAICHFACNKTLLS